MSNRVAIVLVGLWILPLMTVDAQVVVPESGFLEEYPPLSPMKRYPDALMWRAPDAESKYTALLIDQPVIFIDPKSEYKGVNPDGLKVIADTLHEIVATKAAERNRIVEKPGPGVARLRLALTHVYLEKGGRHGWARQSGTPTAYSLRAAVGRNISLVEATIEAELLDSETDRRLGFMLSQQGQHEVDESDVPEQATSWSRILRTLDYLSEASHEAFGNLSRE